MYRGSPAGFRYFLAVKIFNAKYCLLPVITFPELTAF